MRLDNRVIHVSLILMVAILLTISACTIKQPANLPVETPDTPETSYLDTIILSNNISSPVKVSLCLSQKPILNDKVELMCYISSTTDLPNDTAQIKLSKGIQFIRGDLKWQGDLKANVTVCISSQLVFKETGHQTVEVTAMHINDDNSIVKDTKAIYINIGEESSSFDRTFLSASTPMKVILAISKLPAVNETTDLDCYISSITDMPNSIANINLPKGARLVKGNLNWHGNLKANVSVRLPIQIIFKETGQQIIEATVRHIIDGKLGWTDSDAIYLNIGEESSTFDIPESAFPSIVVNVDSVSLMKTNWEIPYVPKLNESGTLNFTVTSPFDFPNLIADLIVMPNSVELLDSNMKLKPDPLGSGPNYYARQVAGIDLKANEPFHVSTKIVFHEAKSYYIWLHARQKLSSRAYSVAGDMIYLKIGVDESKIIEGPIPSPILQN